MAKTTQTLTESKQSEVIACLQLSCDGASLLFSGNAKYNQADLKSCSRKETVDSDELSRYGNQSAKRQEMTMSSLVERGLRAALSVLLLIVCMRIAQAGQYKNFRAAV